MSDWGVDEEGISTPSYSEILDYFGQRWEEEFGTEADLSSRSPEGQFLRVIAETVSNKGLPWSDITSIWDGIEDVYNAGFLSTASGASLDYITTLRGLSRKGATSATGTVVIYGDEGEEIESGTTVSTQSGITFETTRPVVINKYGVGPVPAQAIEDGEVGNVIAGTITEGEVEVDNISDSHSLHVGSLIDDWSVIPNNEDTNKYQVVPVGLVKYGTNVDEFTVTFKSHSSGLYGVQLAIKDHQTGDAMAKTEVKDKMLDAEQEWEATFVGEGLDLLSTPISDKVRVVPLNMEYSVDDISIAIESRGSESNWYHGSNAQPSSLVLEMLSQIQGSFTGGRDKESDAELKNRFLNSLSRGGSSRASAIKAELYKINSTKHVQVLENNKSLDFRPEGLPPNSIEVVVWGGTNDEVLEALLRSKPAGVNTYGKNIGTIQDEFGQRHQFRYSRAREVNIYIDAEIVTSNSFPANGGNMIKNICADVIGGEDLNGSFHPGKIGVGDTIYQSEVESEIHSQISGIRSIETKFGLSDDDTNDQDISMGDRETPIVKPDNIFLSRQGV